MATAARMGSFRSSLLERREKFKGYSEIGFLGDEEYARSNNCCSYRCCSDKIVGFCRSVQDVTVEAYNMGKSDPRKIVFAAKMGLSLMLISLLIYWKEPVQELSRNAVWAVLTVVVVFEFSIGMYSAFSSISLCTFSRFSLVFKFYFLSISSCWFYCLIFAYFGNLIAYVFVLSFCNPSFLS